MTHIENALEMTKQCSRGTVQHLIHSHFDSSRWDNFKFRDDDIVVASYAKSGTTWIQQILAQLIFTADSSVPVGEISPWLDMTVEPIEAVQEKLEAQKHRRFIKTHLPLNALRFDPDVKYIYVARDGRDVVWSYYNHYINYSPRHIAGINACRPAGTKRFRREDVSVREFYSRWLAQDGYPLWPYWSNIASWWQARNEPNVMLLHFNDLKQNLAGSIKIIAKFLTIDTADINWSEVVKRCTFDYMRSNGELIVPHGGQPWIGGAKTFLHKGVNGRWKGSLSKVESDQFEANASFKLGEQCANWLIRAVEKKG